MFSARSSIPAWAGALLLIVVVGLLGARMQAKLAVSESSGSGQWAMQDFRNAVFYPAVAVAEGVNPYDRGLYEKRFFTGGQGFPAYSPLSVLLHAPFRLLPYTASAWTYFVLVVALTLAFAVFTLRLLDVPFGLGPAFLLAAGILAVRPGYMNILNGQVTMQLIFGSLIALEYGARRPLLGGLGLALATLKPTYAIPLALVMLARGQLRAVVVGTLLGTLGALVGAMWIAGHTGGLYSFFQVLLTNVEASGAAPAAAAQSSWIRVDAVSLLARLLHWQPGLSGSVLVAAIVLAAAAAALFRLRATSVDDDGACGLGGLLAALAVLISVYHQPYDVLLLVPAVISLGLERKREWRELSRSMRRSLLLLTLIPFVNYLAADLVVSHLSPGTAVWTAVVSINAMALTLAFALALAAAAKKATPPEG